MFDGSTSMGIEMVELAEARVEHARAWMALHARIKEAGREERVVKARIIELLLEADETKLFRRMGYATMFAYVEGELGYSHHTATEHMRVAHELVTLPETAAVFGAGELSWTSARELTRVVTPKTESVWLDAVEGKTTASVVEMLRGKGKGDLPERRKIWIRDGGRCVVPGCRSTRHLSVHHLVFREHGGRHELWNLVLMCDAHDKQLHDGIIRITGRAPDLVFELPVPRGTETWVR